jgi:hypothetical protein
LEERRIGGHLSVDQIHVPYQLVHTNRVTIGRGDFVERFGKAILSGNAAMFVGAGLSQAAGYPGWGQLLRPLQTRCGIPDQEDLPLVAEYIVLDSANGGRTALETHIERQLAATVPMHSSSHYDLNTLDIKEIWTTNYDRLLETAIPNAAVISNDAAVHEIASHGRSIIKMHGSIGPQQTWEDPPVITRSDYERYANRYPRMWTVLRSTYMSRSMLFLGFSFTDPNIEVLLRLARTLGTAQRDRHIAVMKAPDLGSSTPEGQRRHNLRIADLENSGVTVHEVPDYAEIPTLLADLVLRTRPPHLFLSGSSDIVDATPEKDETTIGRWCSALRGCPEFRGTSVAVR